MVTSANSRLRVAVVGLGSIGGVAAGCLAAAGRHDIVACMRRPIERFTLDQPDGAVEVKLNALTEPAGAKPVDWVLLCTKTHQTKSAAPWLARLCTPSTCVAVLQNGIGHVARVAPFAQGATVLPVIVYYNGERLAPDRVRLRQGSDQDLAVADDEAGRAFAALFEGTPLRVLRSNEFATLIWRKLLINAVANPITTLTLQRQAVLRRPDVQELCTPSSPKPSRSRAPKVRISRTTSRPAQWQRCLRFQANSAPRCISTGSPAATSKSKP